MGKNSFVMYKDWNELFNELTDIQSGELIKAIYSFECSGEYEISDPIVKGIFMTIKTQLKNDNEKYAETCKKRAEAGSLGGRPTNTNMSSEKQTKAKKANAFSEKQTKAKKAEYEYEYEYEYDNDDDIYIGADAPAHARKRKTEKEVKHKYGEYKHVRLTDTQYKRLNDEFGESALQLAIKILDEYCQEKGKSYSDYNLTLRRWAIDEARKKLPKEVPKEQLDSVIVPLSAWTQ